MSHRPTNRDLDKDIANQVIDLPLSELKIVARHLRVLGYWRFRKGRLVPIILGYDKGRLEKALEIRPWERIYERNRGKILLVGTFVVLAIFFAAVYLLFPDRTRG